jgi:AraC-like DNA-binding protein
MDHRVRATIDLINANLHRELTLSEMNLSVQLSPSHLRQLFRAETGMSLGRYLKKARLHRASQLLESTFLTVKEVAARVGLQNVNHFITDFKKAYKLTPGQYATHHRGRAAGVLSVGKLSNR